MRHFYLDTLLGNLAETVAVASASSGDCPKGSVLQLMPDEVMIERQKGFSPVTRDWEFFERAVAATDGASPLEAAALAAMTGPRRAQETTRGPPPAAFRYRAPRGRALPTRASDRPGR